MTALDWLALIVVATSLLLGAWRGLLYEVLAIAGWVVFFWGEQMIDAYLRFSGIR